VAATKEALGLDPNALFAFDPAVLSEVRKRLAARMADERADWQRRFLAWRDVNPQRAALLDRLRAQAPADGLTSAFPAFPEGGSVSTRKASGQTINAIAAVMPELWGGSADLAESNDTTIVGGGDFLPSSSPVPTADPYGRVIHFGIREHAMGAILNGIALDGLTRPFGGTFLVFSDYMRGSVRLAALMALPVVYVWSHDSIGVGEDGPTHQPVEHLWSLRAIPGLSVVRPADAHETAAAWHAALARRGPVGLILTRQNVPVLDAVRVDTLMRGAYVKSTERGPLTVILMATGSEVHLALAAQAWLESDGIGCRVVSMPCLEWFDEQSADYRGEVLPAGIRARVAIEAGSSQGWWRYVGDAGRVVGIDRFGASADGAEMFRRLGMTVEDIVAAARASIAQVDR
jgi:transketolase